MQVSSNGVFSLDLGPEDLVKGLRLKSHSPRNTSYLTKSSGAVGKDGVLQTLPQLTKTSVGDLTFTYPYPQIFKLKSLSILCNEFKIYELVSSTWTLKYTETTETTGYRWSLVDYHNYIYMSNGVVAVVRNDMTGAYSATTDPPVASAMCDFNGQVIICPA